MKSCKRNVEDNGDSAIQLVYENDIIGLRSKIYWPKNRKYFEATIHTHDPSRHMWLVIYDDYDREWIDVFNERDRVYVFDHYRWNSLEEISQPVENQLNQINHNKMDTMVNNYRELVKSVNIITDNTEDLKLILHFKEE